MKKIVKLFNPLIFIVLLVITLWTAYFISFRAAQSWFLGLIFGFANFQILKWSWNNILNKKLIALSASVIVIKYSFFVAIIYLILQSNYLLISWFVIGFTVILVSSIIKLVLVNRFGDLCQD